MKPFLSIIIPAYNEENRITSTLESISGFLRQNNFIFEIIVVPNNCTDNTLLVVNNIKSTYIPEIIILNINKLGVVGNTKGAAIKAGMNSAKGDYHIFIDADNATYFGDIINFINLINNGSDLVIGSRYIKGSNIIKKQSLSRIILSRIGNILTQILILPGVFDTQCGFKMFSSSSSKKIFSKSVINGWGADIEMLAIARHLSLKITEFPITWKNSDNSRVNANAFLFTLKELFNIKSNIRRGIYGKKNKE